ncbi:MAG: mechanosensitive ion channel protein MscS [Cohnella sp.]|uniref:mechanosensitive ion channel family protein n=1 Tax=Cohnella sp. TaxID=1883426 RepID=UPI000E3710D2|nr:mechanosensitive ion channel family protein [Cohnella sp.]REK60992.1 MAG: mechanosensitive ion channel protein MscS [Cohnella sp.]
MTAANDWEQTLADNTGLWQQFVEGIWATVTDTSMWMAALEVLLRIVMILVISRIARIVVNRIIDQFTHARSAKRLKIRTRRVQTVGKLLKNTAGYAINFIVILLILSEFHISLGPLLAGAGVVGLAIGFGAQSLVKDVISGFFIILEDHFSVGDVIETGKFKGTVEMIGLRSTRIRNWTGEVHIIPNGSIVDVTNYSVHESLAVVDFSVAATDSLDEATDTIRGVLNRFEDPNVIGKPELLGVQSMGASDVVLRITAVCKPNTQGSVSRRLNAELKKAFEAAENPRYFSREASERVVG